MKKILLCSIIILAFAAPVFAEREEFPGIGLDIFKEPYSKKVIITDIIPDSPAQNAGITIGTELVSINDEKAKNLSVYEIYNRISGNDEHTVKITIKNDTHKFATYNLKNEFLTIDEPNHDPYFEMLWSQVAPTEFKDADPLDPKIVKQFSKKYRKNIIPLVTYWLNRKKDIMPEYNYCMTTSAKNRETCIVRLLITENEKTEADKQKYKFMQKKMPKTSWDERTLSPSWIQKYRYSFDKSMNATKQD